jgi:ATP-dependent Clp protease ATP-binding subunit ClpX
VAAKKRSKKMQTVRVESIHCTFCGKEHSETGPLIAGPGVYICEACVGLCLRILTDKATAAFATWKDLSDEELLATLPASSAAVDSVDAKLRDHVALLRDRGVSWERIAAALGVSRQAAWERFSG